MAALKSRWRRWLRRIGVAAITFTVLLVALVGWYRPTLGKIALWAANRALPDFAIEAGEVRREGFDRLEIGSLRVRLRADGSEVVALERVNVVAGWRDLRAHRIRELRLAAPDVRVSDSLLAVVTTLGSGGSGAVPWTIDRLVIERGRLGVKLDGTPALSVALETQLTGVRTAGAGDDAEQKVRLSELRLVTRDAAAGEFVRVPAVDVTFNWRDLRERQRVTSVRIRDPEIRFDAAVRRALATVPRTDAPAAATPLWRVGSVQVSGARMRLEEFADAAPGLTFAADAELSEVPLGADREADVERLQVVTIRGLEVRAPGADAEPFVRAPIIRARFRWRELLADRWINSVDLERARVRWDGALQSTFAGAPTAATPSAAKPEIYRIGVLQVSRASLALQEPGAGIPSATFDLDAGLTEVPLGTATDDLPDAAQAVAIRDLALVAPGETVSPFFHVPAIYGTFTWRGLVLEKRLGMARIEQPEFRYEPSVGRALAAGASPGPGAVAKPEQAWRVEELAIFDGKVHLRDLGLGLPQIEFGVNTSFKDLALSLDGEALREAVQTIELHQISLQSPVDPFASVLKLPTLFVRFTPAGLWRRQIEQVEVIGPVLNVGEDLFWYIDRMQGEDRAAAPPGPETRSWTVNRFDLTSGQLVLAFDGRPKLPLPLPFETHARNLNFNRLSELRLTLDLVVPEQDYVYPDYQLTLRGVSGRVQFSVPPEKAANNLVQTLRVAEVRWKDYRARELFLGLTFDEKAIHGELGGRAYEGYLRGAFDFGLDAASSWNGWISGSRVNLGPLSAATAPETLSLSGPADFSATVAARATEIEKFEGDFRGRGRGELRVGKLNDLIRELPPEWTALKRSLTRIGLETVRDFTYDSAHGDFRFLGRSGRATLDLRGPGGSRVVEAIVHDDRGPAVAVRTLTDR